MENSMIYQILARTFMARGNGIIIGLFVISYAVFIYSLCKISKNN